MITESLQRTLAWAMIGLAVVTALALRFVVAPYGRHTRGGWGPQIPDRLGWLLMESPSALGFAWVFFHGSHWREVPRLVLASLWLLHYGHRTFVYPLRMKSQGKKMPLVIALMAIGFNVLNVSVNATWIGSLGEYPDAWLSDPRFVVGVAMFVTGFVVNYDADRRLFRLRARSSGYSIPKGGLYRWVTCPNYLGELLEWSGWALASFSLGGLAFAL